MEKIKTQLTERRKTKLSGETTKRKIEVINPKYQ